MPVIKNIDMSAYPRREHFEYFNAMPNPYVGVTVNVDITDFAKSTKEKGLPFFLSFLYAAANAANSIPEMRRRIAGDGIVEYDNCPTSHTVSLPDGRYCYCLLREDMPFAQYIPYAVERNEAAKTCPSLDEGDDKRQLFFISCVPWLSYTALLQPTPAPADSNPRITWGKYFAQDGKILMPVTILCNHALVDGIHIARFYERLDIELKKI